MLPVDLKNCNQLEFGELYKKVGVVDMLKVK
jgi:hypothetical protein